MTKRGTEAKYVFRNAMITIDGLILKPVRVRAVHPSPTGETAIIVEIPVTNRSARIVLASDTHVTVHVEASDD